jgi:hypothetical protein
MSIGFCERRATQRVRVCVGHVCHRSSAPTWWRSRIFKLPHPFLLFYRTCFQSQRSHGKQKRVCSSQNHQRKYSQPKESIGYSSPELLSDFIGAFVDVIQIRAMMTERDRERKSKHKIGGDFVKFMRVASICCRCHRDRGRGGEIGWENEDIRVSVGLNPSTKRTFEQYRSSEQPIAPPPHRKVDFLAPSLRLMAEVPPRLA